MEKENFILVIHRVGGEYVNEVYKLNRDGSIFSYVPRSVWENMVLSKMNKVELNHGADYEKIKSPFLDEEGNALYLYGRYVFIGTRPDKYGSRF